VSTEYEEVSLDTFIGILKTELAGANGGTIECVVLNACEKRTWAKRSEAQECRASFVGGQRCRTTQRKNLRSSSTLP
jgi:hypothetical protein